MSIDDYIEKRNQQAAESLRLEQQVREAAREAAYQSQKEVEEFAAGIVRHSQIGPNVELTEYGYEISLTSGLFRNKIRIETFTRKRGRGWKLINPARTGIAQFDSDFAIDTEGKLWSNYLSCLYFKAAGTTSGPDAQVTRQKQVAGDELLRKLKNTSSYRESPLGKVTFGVVDFDDLATDYIEICVNRGYDPKQITWKPYPFLSAPDGFFIKTSLGVSPLSWGYDRGTWIQVERQPPNSDDLSRPLIPFLYECASQNGILP